MSKVLKRPMFRKGGEVMEGRGSKLAEILGATEKPSQNLFAALDKKAASDRQINLQGAILGIKGQQAIDVAKAKAQNKFQKEFSRDRQEFEYLKEFTKEAKGFSKSLNQLFAPQMAKFLAKTSKDLDKVEAFKGKNVQTFPHTIRGTKATFNANEMLPGTIYFRPDQQNSVFERDPDKNVIIHYDIFTGRVIREIPLGG
jgi:hypothetical protein